MTGAARRAGAARRTGWRAVAARLALAAAALAIATAVATTVAAPPEVALRAAGERKLGRAGVRGLASLPGGQAAMLVVEPAAAPRASLIILDAQGRVVRAQDCTGSLTDGLAWDGRCFWSCGETAEGPARLHRVSPSSLASVASWPLPGRRPRGVAWDGQRVWVADRDAGRLVAFEPERGQTLAAAPAPGLSPTGLAWDGAALWVADAGAGRLFRWDPATGALTGIAAVDGGAARAGELVLAGEPGRIWVALPGAAVATLWDTP